MGVHGAGTVCVCCLHPKSFELGEQQQRAHGAAFPPVCSLWWVFQSPSWASGLGFTWREKEMETSEFSHPPQRVCARFEAERGEGNMKEDAPSPQKKWVLNVN